MQTERKEKKSASQDTPSQKGNEQVDAVSTQDVEMPFIGPEPVLDIISSSACNTMTSWVKEKRLQYIRNLPGLCYSKDLITWFWNLQIIVKLLELS